MASLVGLRNFRVVKITQDDDSAITYDSTITMLKGAKTVKITPKSETAENYGDDQLLETATASSGIEVEIEVAELTLEEYALLTGAAFSNGILKETKDFNPPELALGFEASKSNGKVRNVWLVKGKCEPIEEEGRTKEDKLEFQSRTVKFKFMPRIHDGVTKYTADEDGTSAVTPSQFFTTTFLQTGTV